jgi:D-alanine-D-alanine ligase
MKRVVILYGGKSGEHEVSLQSAASILRHLDPRRYDPRLVGIGPDGAWTLQTPESMARAMKDSGPLAIEAGNRVFVLPGGGRERGLSFDGGAGVEGLACDAVFPVLHGTFGEDGTIQGLLECAELPYVGAPVLGSALGMDKEKAKLLWMQAGIPVVPFLTARRPALDAAGGEDHFRREVGSRLGYPVFVKPACAGSSVGASKVEGPDALVPALRAALEWDDKALIEAYIAAREIECSVIGNAALQAFAPGEVVPSHEFYDYEAKYIDPDGARLDIPAMIGDAQAARVRALAIAACACLEISGMARVDFFIDRRSGEVLLNEVNTIPGFTHISMYPKMCAVDGLPYSALISRLVELAIERHEARLLLRYNYKE